MTDQIQRGSRRNFFIVFNAIFDEWEHFDLDTFDVAVYFCLLRYSDNNTQKAFPGQTHIAKVTRMSERRVRISIKNLKGQGLIDVTPRYEKKGQISNLYIVYDANEVIHRGGTSCRGGRHEVPGGEAPDASGGVHQVPPKKTHLNILNEEEESAASSLTQTEIQKLESVYLNCYQDKTGATIKRISKQNRDALKKLGIMHGEDLAAKLLQIWFDNADKGTVEKVWPVNFLLNDEAIYLTKLREYEAEEQQRAKLEEQQRQRWEEERQEAEAERQEEARREALTPQQRRLEDITSKRSRLELLIDMWQDSTTPEGAEKAKAYQEKLNQLNQEEAELLPQLKQI